MPNASAAERILELVTSTDRASSTVGDLLEQTSERGNFWFWNSIARTAVSYVWQDLCDLRGMAWLALLGLVELRIFAWALAFNVILVTMAIWPYQLSPNVTYIPPWSFYGLLVATRTAVPLLVGWDVARRSHGRELASAVALSCTLAVTSVLKALHSGAFVYRVEQPYPYVQNTLIFFCAEGFFVVTGALLFRVRAQRIRRSATGLISPRQGTS